MGESTEELSTEIAGTRQRMASDLDALQDRVSPSAIMDRRKEAARSGVLGVRDKIMGKASDVRSGAGSAGSGATDTLQGAAQGAAHGVQGQVQGSPLAAGLVAFGAGVVIAGLIPATAKEAQLASTLADTAQEKGGPLVEQAKSLGQEMGQDLKDRAAGAAQEVKDTATESVGRVKDEGQTAAENVRSEARPNG
jgi:gas vesicle protein